MSAAREKDQADFDLEAFIDLFDEALTSDDPSVQKTLQHLMVIAALARNHDGHSKRSGPLRRIFDDQSNIIRRLERLEVGNTTFGRPPGPGGGYNPSTPYGPVVIPSPYVPSTPVPGTGGGGWPGPGPNQIWCGTGTNATGTLDPGYGAVPPSSATSAIAERVESLLQSDYRGSTVGKF
jgi:hypothetical protein